MSGQTIDYAALAQQARGGAPVDYAKLAEQARSLSTTQPAAPQKGFLESAWDSGPVSGLIHGAAAVGGLLNDAVHLRPASDDNPIVQAVHNSPTINLLSDAVHGRPADNSNPIVQGVQELVHNGPTLDARRKLANSIPLVGDALATAEQQSDAGNNAGAMGTMVGTGANFIAPELIKAAIPAATAGVGRVALLGKTPEAAYESAMKPSTTISQADRASMVQTGLDNAIPVSKAGVEKIGDLINDLNTKIKATIDADPNRPIDPNSVATRTDATSARFANQVNAQPDLNAIEASKQQFLTEQGAKPGSPAIAPKPTGILDAQGNPYMTSGTPAQPATSAPDMGAADAQSMKQGTYGVLKGKFGEQGSASVEAQKALARGLKEEIATQFPEINTINAAESRLLDLQPVLERAVNRISNHQLIGIGTPVAGAAAEAMTGSTGVGQVAMVLKAVLDNPNVKSRLAIAISKSQKVPIATAMNRVNAYSTGLASTAAASQANSSDDSSDQATIPQAVQQ